jgi:hypothetical protein
MKRDTYQRLWMNKKIHILEFVDELKETYSGAFG